MFTQRELRILVSLNGACAYNSGNKAAFKRLSMALLRDLRDKLQMPDADVRYNAGGIAVSGDATLHADNVYVQFNADRICDLGVMFRTCKGKKDYTGGHNNFFSFELLEAEGVEGLAIRIKRLLKGRSTEAQLAEAERATGVE